MLPAALAGHTGGTPPSDVIDPLEEPAPPEPLEETALPLPVAGGPDPPEVPEALEPPLPMTGVPELLGRELHAPPTAPMAIVEMSSARRR